MSRWIMFLFLTTFGVCLGEPEYPLRFNAQLSLQDFPGMENTLKDWRKSRPNDPEWLVAQGSYFYSKSQKNAPLLPAPGAVETPVVWCPTPAPPTDLPARNPAYFA